MNVPAHPAKMVPNARMGLTSIPVNALKVQISRQKQRVIKHVQPTVRKAQSKPKQQNMLF